MVSGYSLPLRISSMAARGMVPLSGGMSHAKAGEIATAKSAARKIGRGFIFRLIQKAYRITLICRRSSTRELLGTFGTKMSLPCLGKFGFAMGIGMPKLRTPLSCRGELG